MITRLRLASSTVREARWMVTNSGSVLSNIQSKPIRMHQKAKPSTRRLIARQSVVVGRSDSAPLVPALLEFVVVCWTVWVEWELKCSRSS